MYRKILVAYDGSSFSSVALEQGKNLSRLCNAELHLVGIVAIIPYSTLGEGFAGLDIWELEREPLERALDEAGQKLSAQGVNAVTAVREGNPAAEIAAYAEEIGADLVVVGHSDKGVITRWFEGSVGAGLLKALPCNLLIASS